MPQVRAYKPRSRSTTLAARPEDGTGGADSGQCSCRGPSQERLRRIAELYAIEAEIRGSPPDRRLAEWQKRSAPLVQAFGGWLKQQRARVSPKSCLGEKLAYIARHWQGLQLFLADGLDNVSFHDLRHSYTSVALAHGETVLTIGRLLGHNDPATTLKYTHLADAAVRNAVEAVSTVLEGRN